MPQPTETNPWIVALNRLALMTFSPPTVYAWRMARRAEREPTCIEIPSVLEYRRYGNDSAPQPGRAA